MNKRSDQADASINIFEQIDEVCKEFKKALKSGSKPKIEGYLNRVDESALQNLFTNLLLSELKHRFKTGDTPKSTDYLKRFPQFANIIRQEFDESTMGSMDFDVDPAKGSTGTASELISDGSQTRTFEEPAASRLGDYELIRELGRGGFGVVYEARHIKQKNKVALKTLPTGSDGQEINADRLHKFRREFRTLSEINHPNLVGMQTLEFDGNQWFFTMDLIQGTDFLSYVRPKDWLDEKHLRSSLKQLAAGIMALHDKGIVHRDLKPSNVLVEPNSRVVILDFGLVAQLQQNTDMTATRSAMFAGTPRYAAPEQMFGERSEASDWYAMGVMLYEALTGAPPFPGRNPMEVLRQKQDEDPPSISANDGIPTDLSTLADALIKRDPKQRLTTNQIAQQLQLDLESTKQQSAGSTDDEDIDLDAIPEEEIELIGREKQLAQLEAAKQQLLETRKPVVCWITGLSGEGKSALAEKFLAPIRRGTEMLVLSGRCYDCESIPFKAIDSLIDSLVRFLRGRSENEIKHLLPEDIQFLAHLFPLLRRVEAIENECERPLQGIADKQIQFRAFKSLRRLLYNIGQTVPILVFIDDLQWGDADSTQAVVDLVQLEPQPPILLLGSYRKDEAEESPFLKAWQESYPVKQQSSSSLTINVSPLTWEECLRLVVERTGSATEQSNRIAEAVFNNTKGNPYFVDQLIEGLDQMDRDFEPVPFETIVAGRLKKCPAGAEKILEIVAVAGKAFPIAEVSSVANYSKEIFATLTHMRSEKLLRLVGSNEQQLVDTYHDKVRESVLSQLEKARVEEIHLQIAQAIERELNIDGDELYQNLSEKSADLKIGNRVFDLAYHYDCANDSKKALVYCLLSMESAKAQFALTTAVELYDVAEKHLDAANNLVRLRLTMFLIEVLIFRGSYSTAIETINDALNEERTQPERLKLMALKCEALYKSGSLLASISEFKTVLAMLGISVPQTPIGTATRLRAEPIKRFFFDATRWLPANKKLKDIDSRILAIKILSLLGLAYFWRNIEISKWALSATHSLANRIPESPLHVLSFVSRANYLCFRNTSNDELSFKKSEYWYKKAVSFAKMHDDDVNLVFALRFRGIGNFQCGFYRESVQNLNLAIDICLTKISDSWQLNMTTWWLGLAKFGIAEFSESASLSKQFFDFALSAKQNGMALMSIESWARAMHGDLDVQQIAAAIPKDAENHTSKILLDCALARWHLRWDRLDCALTFAERAFEMSKKYRLYQIFTARSGSLYLKCLRLYLDHPENNYHQTPQRNIKHLVKTAKFFVNVTNESRSEKVCALRELGLAYHLNGNTRKAKRFIRQSMDLAKKRQMPFELAQSNLAMAYVEKDLGKPNSEQAIEAALNEIEKFDIVNFHL